MYKDYASYLAERFPGKKIQKITIDAGFTCPNRDGTIGRGGCIYCNNEAFSPDFAKREADVVSQIERGKIFFARKYPQMRYLAYFQSYTGTHANRSLLMKYYSEALSVDGVEGLVIGTRPDCVDEPLLEQLADINRRHRVIIEYGAESSHNDTLLRINRCHTWEDTVRAVGLTRQAGLDVGLHFIMGLPGESEQQMLSTVDAINRLKPDVVKFHQLQIIANTPLASMWQRGEVDLRLFSQEEYLELCCKIVNRLSRDIAIERFTASSPASMLLAPKWGIKNYEFVDKLKKMLKDHSSIQLL